VVNELFMMLGLESVTAAAFSQARKRIRHTAFIELNEQAIVNVMYREGEYLRYKGFRVLAIDGSKIRLPETEEINQEFGQVAYTNGQNEEIKGYHT
jgi:phage FluMu gp28-like protein